MVLLVKHVIIIIIIIIFIITATRWKLNLIESTFP